MMESPCRVLVIEDEALILMLIENALTAVDCEVSTAVTGEEALLRAQEHPPNLVVLDLRLPGDLMGVELLRRLRELSPRPFPVIVATGTLFDEGQQRDLEQVSSGPVSVLTKPYDPQDLVAEVMAKLGKGRA